MQGKHPDATIVPQNFAGGAVTGKGAWRDKTVDAENNSDYHKLNYLDSLGQPRTPIG
jgi:hypothetical protein